MSRAALPDHDLKDLLASLQRGSMTAKDQLRRLSAVANSNTVTSDQVIAIIDCTRTIQVDVIVLLYPAMSDQENLENILSKLKFTDEREEVKKRIAA